MASKAGITKKGFFTPPFDQIENIGFCKSYLNLNTKWHFTEEIKEGKLNDFNLIVDISCERGTRIIEFEALTEWKQLDKGEYSRLTEKFRRFNIEFRIGSLVKQYDTRRLPFHTIQELKADLVHFTQALKLEKFESRTQPITKYAER